MKFEDYDVYDRHQISFDVVIKTLSPLSHIGESIGNQSNLRIEKITTLAGREAKTFVYSGNALRNGVLRRRGTLSELDQLGITLQKETHQTLYAGGYIDGGTAVDLDLDKKIRQLIPSIGALGTAKPKGVFGSKDAQMIPGRMNIGAAYLVCYESLEMLYRMFPAIIPYQIADDVEKVVLAKDAFLNDLIESRYHKRQPDPQLKSDYLNLVKEYDQYFQEVAGCYRNWLDRVQKVRMDSLKDPHLARHLLDAKPVLKESQQMSLFGETESKAKPKEKKDSHTQQMIMSDLVIRTGATLYSRWSGNITDIEEGFIADALLKFAESPYLGGKSGTGCGLVQIDIYYQSKENSGHWLHISPSNQVISDRCNEQHQRYLSYLDEYRNYIEDVKNSGEIRGFLGI